MTITVGSDVIKPYKDSNTTSGNTITRWFCSNCGSPIYLVNEKFDGLTILYSGSVEGRSQQVKPSGELFAHNRRDWFQGVEGAAKL
jgi:hypothetical protein